MDVGASAGTNAGERRATRGMGREPAGRRVFYLQAGGRNGQRGRRSCATGAAGEQASRLAAALVGALAGARSPESRSHGWASGLVALGAPGMLTRRVQPAKGASLRRCFAYLSPGTAQSSQKRPVLIPKESTPYPTKCEQAWRLAPAVISSSREQKKKGYIYLR